MIKKAPEKSKLNTNPNVRLISEEAIGEVN
jgi:hypothetical protein